MGNCWGPRKTPQPNMFIAPPPPPTFVTGGTKHGHGGVHGHGTVHSSTTSAASSMNKQIPGPSERCKPITSHQYPRASRSNNGHHEALSSPHLKDFTYSDLRYATRNFKTVLGEGGFGFVYKGWIDRQTHAAPKPGTTTTVVAVKKLKPQGFQGHKEWLSEVNYLGQLRHPHLVKLIGYCLDGDNRLLVYEYMPKGSLENHLFSRSARPLSWGIRIKVAIGAARGLSFLHGLEQQVIYRDFKASNILLDSEFNAKLSDFGLAKAGPTGDRSHVSTQVLGTQGYAAPEYIATGHLTVKCDIYSFGVVLLELLSGRRVVDKSRVRVEQNLVDWAKPCLGDPRKLIRVMDIKLEGQYPKKGAFMLALLALECLADAKNRPSMGEVLDRLKKVPVPAPKEQQPHSEQQHHHHQEQHHHHHHHHHQEQQQHHHHHYHHHHHQEQQTEKQAQSMSIPRPKSPLPSPPMTPTSSSSSPLSSEVVPLAPNTRVR